MKLLQRIFCRVYLSMVRFGNGDVAEYYSIMFMVLLFFINATSVFILASFCGIHIELNPSKTTIIITCFSFIGILYFLLVKDKKYLKNLDDYKNESQREKNLGHFLVIASFFASIIILDLCFFLKMQPICWQLSGRWH